MLKQIIAGLFGLTPKRSEPEVVMETNDNCPPEECPLPPNGPEPVVPVQCPCCFSMRDPQDVAVVSVNGVEVIRLCSPCIQRTMVWASKSSLGFLLKPPPEPQAPQDNPPPTPEPPDPC